MMLGGWPNYWGHELLHVPVHVPKGFGREQQKLQMKEPQAAAGAGAAVGQLEEPGASELEVGAELGPELGPEPV